MIVREGNQICEHCGTMYNWKAIKQDENFKVSRIENLNIDFFDIVNNCRLIATSKCPKCHKRQIMKLVDEPWPIITEENN